MRPRTVLIAGLLASLFLVAVAVPAGANTREFHLVTFDESNETGFCDFPVIDTEVGTFAVTDYLDSDGNIVQTLITAYGQLTLTFTNPENGKNVVTHNESQMIRITYDEDGSFDTIYRTGVIFAFTAPGVGTVLMQVGRLIQAPGDGFVFVAGPNQLLEGHFEALCAALS